MKTKMYAILIILLGIVSVFAQSDVDDPTPVIGPAPQITPNPDGSEVYVQVINNAPGMWEYRWFNQDFSWNHTFDPEGKRILSATLEIAAWDVDLAYGEIDLIYADGQLLGNLQGANYSWSVTSFNLSVEALSDGVLDVFINIDSTHTRYWWAVTIGWSKLTVIWEPIEIRTMQDAIDLLNSIKLHLPNILPYGNAKSVAAKLDAAIRSLQELSFPGAFNQLNAAINELRVLSRRFESLQDILESKARILESIPIFFQAQEPDKDKKKYVLIVLKYDPDKGGA